MAKKTKRISSFKGKTKANTEKRKKGNSFSYLNLPKGIETFVPETNSKVIFDVMPYLVTDKNHPDKDVSDEVAVKGTYWYKRPFKVHRNIGVRSEAVVCPTSFGKKCPICEYQQKLRKEDADEDEIKALKTTPKNLYAVIVQGKGASGKVQIFEFSDFLFQKKLEEEMEDQDKYDFMDHMEGSHLFVRFAEATFGGNKYPEPTRMNFEERKEQYDDSILDEIPKLDELLIVHEYDELKAMFFDGDINDDDDEDEDDEPKRKPKTSKKPVKDDDEDEDDEDEDDEAEEEEDEDDEEEEEDDEPAPPPAKKRRGKPAEKSNKPLTCPFDHRFGKDNDQFDDCDDCEIWNECAAAKKSLKSKK